MSVSLSKRLMLCAGLVAGGKTVCDFGTDHALLPVYLVENGVCERAHACDIADGPLKSAQKSVEASPCADRIRIIKSDGLDNVSPEGISDVVIAGMGGELIIDIVARRTRDTRTRARCGSGTCTRALYRGRKEVRRRRFR